jgi:hypothetical protein
MREILNMMRGELAAGGRELVRELLMEVTQTE